MSRFAVHVGDFDIGNESEFELPHIAPEYLKGIDIKEAIYGRCGVRIEQQRLLYDGLFDHMVLMDEEIVSELLLIPDMDDLNFLLVLDGMEAPFTKIPDYEEMAVLPLSNLSNMEISLFPSLPPLLPSVERIFTIGGTSTVEHVLESLFSLTTHYSEVVTSVRGKVVASDGTSHVVYPFVFRAGGKDVRVTWAAELRERLAASIHPATLGRDVYRSAIEALDDTPSPSSSVTWDLTISISARPSPF